jgi:hypothetical protein
VPFANDEIRHFTEKEIKIGNEHMKTWSVSLAVREIKKYHETL